MCIVCVLCAVGVSFLTCFLVVMIITILYALDTRLVKEIAVQVFPVLFVVLLAKVINFVLCLRWLR